ncbi:hypothetical protein [Streptosporangium sp. NPDC006007]|uniref:hypothetical protein n=1 Tax=Streptosporangium sp. NPDC006007 TaxID=3154575 RepID=UPI0033B7B96F
MRRCDSKDPAGLDQAGAAPLAQADHAEPDALSLQERLALAHQLVKRLLPDPEDGGDVAEKVAISTDG